MAEEDVACVLTERGADPGPVAVVLGDTQVARTAALDPLGAALEPGPDLYPALLRRMAETVAGCLLGEG